MQKRIIAHGVTWIRNKIQAHAARIATARTALRFVSLCECVAYEPRTRELWLVNCDLILIIPNKSSCGCCSLRTGDTVKRAWPVGGKPTGLATLLMLCWCRTGPSLIVNKPAHDPHPSPRFSSQPSRFHSQTPNMEEWYWTDLFSLRFTPVRRAVVHANSPSASRYRNDVLVIFFLSS